HALAHPIAAAPAKPRFTPQTAYIQPLIDGRDIGYFDWLGAATHVAEGHSSSMHGTPHVLDTGYAGIDDRHLYCRVDFVESPAEWGPEETRMVVTVEPVRNGVPGLVCRLEADITAGKLGALTFARNGQAPIVVATESSDGAGPGIAGIAVGMDS